MVPFFRVVLAAPWSRLHDSPPLRLRDLALPEPESLRQHHLDLDFISAVLFLLRAAHRELARWAPDQLHLQAIVVTNLTSFCADKGW
jgi:hypothetical protein